MKIVKQPVAVPDPSSNSRAPTRSSRPPAVPTLSSRGNTPGVKPGGTAESAAFVDLRDNFHDDNEADGISYEPHSALDAALGEEDHDAAVRALEDPDGIYGAVVPKGAAEAAPTIAASSTPAEAEKPAAATGQPSTPAGEKVSESEAHHRKTGLPEHLNDW